MPCSIGANHCGLRHIGWEKSGHSLTSWPTKPFLDELSQLFGYAEKSGTDERFLLGGCLSLVMLLCFSVLLLRMLVLRVHLKCQEYLVIGLKLMGGREGSRKRVRLTRKTNSLLGSSMYGPRASSSSSLEETAHT